MDKDMSREIIKLMVTIVDRGKGQKIVEICKGENLHFHFLCFGLGTASSEILDCLGLGETEKDIVVSMVQSFKIPSLLPVISKEMQLKNPGKGIAFTIPVSGISSVLLTHLLTNEQRKEMELSLIHI